MKAVAVFLLFVGMFMVVQGYYTKTTECPPPTVQVKYIPMSLYEEQLSAHPAQSLAQQFKGMFEDINPWPRARG